MGRLEKQIIAGALTLVGVLLSVVVYRGVERPLGPTLEIPSPRITEWSDPGDATPAKLATQLALTIQPAPTANRSAPSPGPIPESVFPALVPSSVALADSPAEPTLLVNEPVFAEEALARTIVLSTADTWDDSLRIYKVRDGDVLSAIAKRELGSVSRMGEILKLNEGLEPNRLRIGQEITLPGGANFGTSLATTVGSRESASAIKPGPTTHRVTGGDNLTKLALRYSVEGGVQAIVEANPALLLDQNTILSIDWVLSIP